MKCWPLLGMMLSVFCAQGFMRIGHRGACGYEPENTLASFKKALELSVDMIELDVYRCSSGELVVIHDSTLERTTNGTGWVEEKTVAELKTLDAGNGQQIPTLAEVIECVARRAVINIELKGNNISLAVANLIRQYVATKRWSYDDFFVSSFDHGELQLFKQLLPEVATGALLEGIPVSLASFAQECGAVAIGISKDCITQAYVNDAHARGLKVYVFTVDDLREIERIKKFGVDGIFSNYPDRL